MEDEVAIMVFIAKGTNMPVPDVVAYDSSDATPIAHEYSLLPWVYLSMGDHQVNRVLDQLADFLVRLHAQHWDAIGGLNLKEMGHLSSAKYRARHSDRSLTLRTCGRRTKWWTASASRAHNNVRRLRFRTSSKAHPSHANSLQVCHDAPSTRGVNKSVLLGHYDEPDDVKL